MQVPLLTTEAVETQGISGKYLREQGLVVVGDLLVVPVKNELGITSAALASEPNIGGIGMQYIRTHNSTLTF